MCLQMPVSFYLTGITDKYFDLKLVRAFFLTRFYSMPALIVSVSVRNLRAASSAIDFVLLENFQILSQSPNMEKEGA